MRYDRKETFYLFIIYVFGFLQENAHFSISESLIAAIELMKYNLRRREEEGEEEGDSDCEIQQLKQKIRLRRQQIRRSRVPLCTSSQHSKPSFTNGGELLMKELLSFIVT